jgi:hypothetical protein
MGWIGYGIYDGDGTQTSHYNFLTLSKCAKDDDEILDNNWLTVNGTKIPKDRQPIFISNVDKILKKMPKSKFWNEDSAIEWQMLLALFLDNKIYPPKIVFDKGILATEYLIEHCSDDFDVPGFRKRALRNFIKKVKNVFKNNCSK